MICLYHIYIYNIRMDTRIEYWLKVRFRNPVWIAGSFALIFAHIHPLETLKSRLVPHMALGG